MYILSPVIEAQKKYFPICVIDIASVIILDLSSSKYCEKEKVEVITSTPGKFKLVQFVFTRQITSALKGARRRTCALARPPASPTDGKTTAAAAVAGLRSRQYSDHLVIGKKGKR